MSFPPVFSVMVTVNASSTRAAELELDVGAAGAESPPQAESEKARARTTRLMRVVQTVIFRSGETNNGVIRNDLLTFYKSGTTTVPINRWLVVPLVITSQLSQ